MPKLEVEILNQEDTLYKGPASAVTSYNEEGKFDILPNHVNFISIIRDTIIIHRSRKDRKEINIKRGVLRCLQNKVNVFLGI